MKNSTGIQRVLNEIQKLHLLMNIHVETIISKLNISHAEYQLDVSKKYSDITGISLVDNVAEGELTVTRYRRGDISCN